MAKEIERKWLFNKYPNTNYNVLSFKDIKQGYLKVKNNYIIRIRLENNSKAILCFKKFLTNVEREEKEFKIPFFLGKILYKKSKWKLEKGRYLYKHIKNKFTLALDCYLNGLKVIEVEVKDSKDFYGIISTLKTDNIIGKEITGITKYSNLELAKNKLNIR